MKKIYVIGASSSTTKPLQRLAKKSGSEIGFFGRTNPHKLENFVKYDGIFDDDSIDALWKIFIKIIEDDYMKFDEFHLVILPGKSSNNWRESFLINEYLPAVLSEKFAKKMIDVSRESSIVLIGSAAIYQGANKISYAATKASLIGILHTISRKYLPKNRVNLIIPAAFNSGMISDWGEDKREKIAKSIPAGKIGSVGEVADAIFFAINNKFTTNSVINMTGGSVIID